MAGSIWVESSKVVKLGNINARLKTIKLIWTLFDHCKSKNTLLTSLLFMTFAIWWVTFIVIILRAKYIGS